MTIVTALLAVTLSLVGKDLRTDGVPLGMLSFEIAGDPIIANSIVGSWGPARVAAAQTSLAIDYAFLLCYSTTLALACVAASSYFRGSVWMIAGANFAWGAWLAGLLDGVENFALIRVLQGAAVNAAPEGFAVSMARLCALGKFGLIIACLCYVAAARFYDAFNPRLRMARGV
jgi:hypothetical protein